MWARGQALQLALQMAQIGALHSRLPRKEHDDALRVGCLLLWLSALTGIFEQRNDRLDAAGSCVPVVVATCAKPSSNARWRCQHS